MFALNSNCTYYNTHIMHIFKVSANELFFYPHTILYSFLFYGFITIPGIIVLSYIIKDVFVRQINAASVDPEPGD